MISFFGLAADGAGVGAHAGGGFGRLRGHFARVPLVRVCAGGGDGLGLDLAADGAGVGAHAGGGLGRLRGHGAAVPLVAECGLAVALFGRAAAAAGIEVVAVRRAGGRDVPGELIVVRTRRGDGLGPGLAADGAGERAHAGGRSRSAPWSRCRCPRCARRWRGSPWSRRPHRSCHRWSRCGRPPRRWRARCSRACRSPCAGTRPCC